MALSNLGLPGRWDLKLDSLLLLHSPYAYKKHASCKAYNISPSDVKSVKKFCLISYYDIKLICAAENLQPIARAQNLENALNLIKLLTAEKGNNLDRRHSD